MKERKKQRDKDKKNERKKEKQNGRKKQYIQPCMPAAKHMNRLEAHHASIVLANGGGGGDAPPPPRNLPPFLSRAFSLHGI